MFRINGNKGFHIKFKNGTTVSVQFGSMNYCEHSNNFKDVGKEKEKDTWRSKDAEVALWNKEGDWITKICYKDLFDTELYDDVEGYVSPEKVAKIIEWARKYDKNLGDDK